MILRSGAKLQLSNTKKRQFGAIKMQEFLNRTCFTLKKQKKELRARKKKSSGQPGYLTDSRAL